METLVVILAVFGCADGPGSCQPVEALSSKWSSMAACEAGIDAVLIQSANLDFPVITAACQPADDALVAKLLPSPDAVSRKG
jgi:hypothetical protein